MLALTFRISKLTGRLLGGEVHATTPAHPLGVVAVLEGLPDAAQALLLVTGDQPGRVDVLQEGGQAPILTGANQSALKDKKFNKFTSEVLDSNLPW